MDRITQENSALVEQNTTASHHMAQEAEKLQELLNTFKVEDTKSLPIKQANQQIIMNDSTNKISRGEHLLDSKGTKVLAINGKIKAVKNQVS